MNKIDLQPPVLQESGSCSVETARDIACGFARSQRELAITRLPLSLASGRILADTVTATTAKPAFNTATVDGYAVSTKDLKGTGPWKLRIVGSLDAGQKPQERVAFRTHEALRIAAGAAVPPHADAVVPATEVPRIDRTIELALRPEPMAHITRAGADIPTGARLLERETVLTPRHLGLLSSLGHTDVTTYRKLPVAVLSTGSELAEPGDKLAECGIYDANRQMLVAALTDRWLSVRDLGIVGDAPGLLGMVLGEAVGNHRVVITTGGTGSGATDHMAGVIEDLAGDVLVQGIALRPGGTTMVAALDQTLIVALPGDPVAAWIGFELFARPALRAAAGLPEGDMQCETGRALFAFPKARGAAETPLVSVGTSDDEGAVPLFLSTGRIAGNLDLLAKSAGFAVLDEAQGPIAPGDPVNWVRF